MVFFSRGQISVEYLVVTGFVAFLVIGLMGVSYYYTSSIKESIRMNQLEGFAGNVISSAEGVYYSGEPSKTEVSVYLPSGVRGVEVRNDSLIFNVSSQSGMNRISFTSNVVLEGSFSSASGTKILEIKAEEDKVSISEK